MSEVVNLYEKFLFCNILDNHTLNIPEALLWLEHLLFHFKVNWLKLTN